MLMDCRKIDGAAGAEEQDRLDVAAIEAELWFGSSGDELTLIQESMSCIDVPHLADKDPDDSTEGDRRSNGAPKEEDEQTSSGIIFKGLLCPKENCKGQSGKEKKHGIVCCSHNGSGVTVVVEEKEEITCLAGEAIFEAYEKLVSDVDNEIGIRPMLCICPNLVETS
ncbi:hypothetical protein Dimus_018939, partial [Dionaea muscipula]